MADHRAKREKFRVYAAYFPLESVDSVVKLFHSQVTDGTRPDLTLLSIVLGAVEHSLTTSDRVPVGDSEADGNRSLARFPEPIRLREVEDLYQRFSDFVKGSVDLGPFRASGKKTVRSSIELIKNVSNVIWAGLSSSYYKDRAHIQSIYSFLTGSLLIVLLLFHFLSIIVILVLLVVLFGVHRPMSGELGGSFLLQFHD